MKQQDINSSLLQELSHQLTVALNEVQSAVNQKQSVTPWLVRTLGKDQPAQNLHYSSYHTHNSWYMESLPDSQYFANSQFPGYSRTCYSQCSIGSQYLKDVQYAQNHYAYYLRYLQYSKYSTVERILIVVALFGCDFAAFMAFTSLFFLFLRKYT